MSGTKLHGDDIPVPVLAPGLGKTKTGRLWTYVRDDRRDYYLRRVFAEGDRLRTARNTALVRAVENFVWKTYKEHYVDQEVQAFYEENKRWYNLFAASRLNDDEVAKLVAQGKAALDLVAAHATGIEHFMDVQKRTLDLVQDSNRFLAEAAEIAAHGTPQEMQSFAQSVDTMMRNTSYDIMKEAGAGRFSISPDQLEHSWVPQQMLGIAKRLGLVRSSDE